MREILFRGKTVNTGCSVEGDLLQSNSGKVYILDRKNSKRYRVEPETIGQYTGLCDKNGKKIFEGDIVIGLDANPFVVEFVDNEYWCAFCIVERGLDSGDCWLLNEFSTGNGFLSCEVIGNIYDNPELLEADNVHP